MRAMLTAAGLPADPAADALLERSLALQAEVRAAQERVSRLEQVRDAVLRCALECGSVMLFRHLVRCKAASAGFGDEQSVYQSRVRSMCSSTKGQLRPPYTSCDCAGFGQFRTRARCRKDGMAVPRVLVA